MSEKNNLDLAIVNLRTFNEMLEEIATDVKNISVGIFNYDNYERISFYDSLKEESNRIPKSINFTELYTQQDDEINQLLEQYKKEFDLNREYIQEIEEYINIANFNIDNYYETVFNSVVEINSIIELDDDLGDYIVENVARIFLERKINPAIINSDYVLITLEELENPGVVGYLQLIKEKLREVQSSTPYSEAGLEIYKKPESIIIEEKPSNYETEFQNILKNARKYDD